MASLNARITQEGTLSGSMTPRAVMSGRMTARSTLRGRLSPSGVLCGVLSASKGLSGTLTIAAGSIPSYHGETEVTPSNVVQIIECGGLVVPSNIIVDAIPSNYGLIAWDGVTLSVS